MPEEQSSIQQKKILVADDNKVILREIKLALESNGYHVLTATDGALVVKIVDHEIPDLIVLDALFPPDAMDVGMHWDGFAIMRWLQSMSEAKEVPVIMISRTDPVKYRPLCLAAGAHAFLPKPLNMDELVATVRAVLAENQTPTAA